MNEEMKGKEAARKKNDKSIKAPIRENKNVITTHLSQRVGLGYLTRKPVHLQIPGVLAYVQGFSQIPYPSLSPSFKSRN